MDTKTSHYVISAVALTAALGWNNTIRETISTCFPAPTGGMMANIIYAVIITIILLMLIEYLPDTINELPKTTQEKIKAAREREYLINRIQRLEQYLHR
jgi:hypothetical protein